VKPLPPFEQFLMAIGRIDAFQVRSAKGYQQRWGRSFEQAIVELGFVTERALLLDLAQYLGVPCIRVEARTIPKEALRTLPEKLIRARRVIPLAITGDERQGPLVVAMRDPRDLAALDDVRFAAGLPVQPVLASEKEIDQAIEAHFGKPASAPEQPRSVA